jgi:16S rRNA (guanine527-N7)-methyltransferase
MSAGGRRARRTRARPARLDPPPPQPAELSDDRGLAFELTPVSRETRDRLDRFVALLLQWQRRLNLIAESTESTLWTRHIADSLQLLALAPQARVWADLGTGAGFPGLAIACALADLEGARVHLVESNCKKAAFLRQAADEADAPAVVHAVNIAEFVESPPERIEVVTARALAPLSELLTLAYPLLKSGTAGLFPKGQRVEAELTEAAKCWKLTPTLKVSRTDPKARIVVVKGLEPIAGAQAAKG